MRIRTCILLMTAVILSFGNSSKAVAEEKEDAYTSPPVSVGEDGKDAPAQTSETVPAQPDKTPAPATFPSNPILVKKGNPDFIYTADPAAEVFNGKIYVYCSRDVDGAKRFGTMQDYSVLESSDLKTWINHGVVLRPRTDKGFEYADGQMNAPDVAFKDGWYYYYFPYSKTHIGVAKSKTPIGPWESAVKDKITTIFDPTVFVDDDGQAYIYGNDHKVDIGDKGAHVMGAKLKENMIELDGPWQRLSKETVNEAVTIFKRNGIYYFMARVGSSTGYFMADNPLPYPGNPKNLEKPVHSSPEGYASYRGTMAPPAKDAPNHTSAIEFNGKWYLFYHRGDVNGGSFYRRSACFDELNFNEDGTIKLVNYTLDYEKLGTKKPRENPDKKK